MHGKAQLIHGNMQPLFEAIRVTALNITQVYKIKHHADIYKY